MVNPHHKKLPEDIVTIHGTKVNHPTIQQTREHEIDIAKRNTLFKKRKYNQKLKFVCDAMKNYVDRCKTELTRLPSDNDMTVAISCFENLGLYVDEIANCFNQNTKFNVDFDRLDELHDDIKGDIKDQYSKIELDTKEVDEELTRKVEEVNENFNAMEQEPRT